MKVKGGSSENLPDSLTCPMTEEGPTQSMKMESVGFSLRKEIEDVSMRTRGKLPSNDYRESRRPEPLEDLFK